MADTVEGEEEHGERRDAVNPREGSKGPLRNARPAPDIRGWRVLRDLRSRLFER